MGLTRGLELTPEQRAMIEAKIDPTIGGLASEEARRACTVARALPLFLDWTACMAIRPDGEIIWVDYEEPYHVRVVEDERERNIGLFQGSLRHPDLKFLVPTRPADAIDCPHCQGTGQVSPPQGCEPLVVRLVCHCGGNGWLPPRSGLRQDRGRTGRRTFIRSLLLALVLPPILLVLSLLGFFPWSGLNSWGNEIDINSGRIRSTRHLFWVKVASSVRDSALTKALSPEDLSGRPADWHPDTILSPGLHHSPHYSFHGATSQIHMLESCWETGKMTASARREMARQVVHLWQGSGNYFRAGGYIQSCWEKAREIEKQGKAMDVSDLPMPK